jgi:hypothetical protein
MIARVFFVTSALCAVALVVWAAVLFLSGDNGGTFPGAFALWLASGLPLVVAGLLVRAYRRRKASLRPSPHWPDGYRDLPR